MTLQKSRQTRLKENFYQVLPFWIASVATGLISVAYTKLFNQSELLLNRVLTWHRYLIFILAPANFLAAWYIVKQFAPNARGSGIPQVMAAIDVASTTHDKGIRKLLGVRITVVKILSSMLMVLGGGAIGREGPTIQISASVFYVVNRWIPDSWSKLSRKSYFITGAAAGLAAAFNTPLGGIVFAIEELAKIHVSFFRTALFFAVIIAGLTAQGLLGPYLYLGYPDVQKLSGFIFLWVTVCAVLSGIIGAFTSKVILRVISWKQSFGPLKTVAVIIIIGLIVASISYFVEPGILGSGKDLMSRSLFTDNKHVGATAMLSRILGPVLAFNVGAAGGVFAPALAAGASVGSFIAGLLGIIGANANILILSGMVGFLTGVTRTPFTSAILVLEMTDRHNVVFHLMLAALVANIAALLIDQRSFYDHLKKAYIDDAKEATNAGRAR